ncbi:RHS repeat-associated core domain-containing protein [Massilia rubra]|uniref:RHS repeat-associated core domain-containing protein n=1 Tax=Massilia rubra TaxID=2607910 RepID=UPI001E427F98|nr:RHS repeat-associated core domain-containing protein [Massilia rubra]
MVAQNVYYFHNDVSGIPEELTAASGQLAWHAEYRTWGNTVSESWVQTQQTVPLPLAESIPQNLRFQGQYLDRETGLHYNTFRFYDPDIGRFITPDPIGLTGGINLLEYASNPFGWADPLGLSCTPAQLKLNRANGKAWEGTVTSAAKTKYGAGNVQEQVYIRPLDAAGKPVNYRVIADNTIGPAKAPSKIIDSKGSPSAGLTTNQKAGYPLIRNNGGIIESGPGAGTIIPPTPIQVVRPGQLGTL